MPPASTPAPTGPRTNVRNGWVPVWVHFTLSMLFMLAGFVGAFVVPIALGHPSPFLAGAVLAIAGVVIPQCVLHKLVPARCGACGGRCWGRTTPSPRSPNVRRYDTFKYYCERCSKVVDTTFGPGGGGGGP